MLAGGPETILLTWLFLAALWITEWAAGGFNGQTFQPDGRERSRSWKAALRFGVIVALVAGVAAAQLLPFLDLAAHSERGAGYADARWSMPKWGLASFLVPMLYGHISNMGVFFQYDQHWTSSYYLGMGAIVLALLAVWTIRDYRVRLLAAAAVAALLLALGDHSIVYRAVRRLVPQISMMTYPVKFVLVAVFCAPLLAAFTIARMQDPNNDDGKTYRKKLALIAAALLALTFSILFCAWRFPYPTDDFQATLRNGLTRAAFLLATAALLFVFQRGSRVGRSKLLALLLIVLFWLDVLTHEPEQNPATPTWVYEPGIARTKLAMSPQPALGQSRAMVAPTAESKFLHFSSADSKDNFIVNRLGYFADCNLLDAVPKVNGFFSLYPGACGDLISTLYDATNADFPRLADFLSVSQITAPGQFFAWTNRDSFLPLITGGQQPVYLDGTNALLSLFDPRFDGRNYVVLPSQARAWVTVTNRADCLIKTARFAGGTVEVEAQAARPFFIVLSQTYYHCWRAYLDGQPLRILRANYAFQAVESPAGNHRLKLVYEDNALRLGMIISAVSITACVAFWVIGRKSNAGKPHRSFG